ncbi:hypothetical protein J2797_005059 [Paraburkholderia terricola]|jgi:hypothetical protein|uniref:Uncharacterized protein n=1 Tax=Paraburkholderia terricola TaxID=169427 RepID=A0A1M6RB32_9BURK|nr:hypothetical protein [Paraburkholderia terricola]MDR6495143.1 hypothetical protein [Paraburkholderia terricola]SDP21197.1 hypothetical protein SAMN05192547_104927 [Paraburkholderia sediminicola]SHK29695.1 hypothetical protein SAMN05192548_101827 [Paraburkholderia terricola]
MGSGMPHERCEKGAAQRRANEIGYGARVGLE